MKFVEILTFIILTAVGINCGLMAPELIQNAVGEEKDPKFMSSDVSMLFDYEANLILSKDERNGFCIIRHMDIDQSVDVPPYFPPFDVVTEAGMELTREEGNKLSKFYSSFCGQLPTFTMVQQKKVHRRKRNAIGNGKPYILPGSRQEVMIMSKREYEILRAQNAPVLAGFRRRVVPEAKASTLPPLPPPPPTPLRNDDMNGYMMDQGVPAEEKVVDEADGKSPPTILSSGTLQWDSSDAWPVNPPLQGPSDHYVLSDTVISQGQAQSYNKNGGKSEMGQQIPQVIQSNQDYQPNHKNYQQSIVEARQTSYFTPRRTQASNAVLLPVPNLKYDRTNGGSANIGNSQYYSYRGNTAQQNNIYAFTNQNGNGFYRRGVSNVQYASSPQVEIVQSNEATGTAEGAGNLILTSENRITTTDIGSVEKGSDVSSTEILAKDNLKMSSFKEVLASEYRNINAESNAESSEQLGNFQQNSDESPNSEIASLQSEDKGITKPHTHVYSDYALQGQGQELRQLPNNDNDEPQQQRPPGLPPSSSITINYITPTPPSPPLTTRVPGATAIPGTAQGASTSSGDKPKCCIITFTCTLISDSSNQRKQICRPKQQNTATGTNGTSASSRTTNGSGSSNNGSNSTRGNQIVCCKCV